MFEARYPQRVNRTRRTLLVALLAVAGLVFAGCTPTSPGGPVPEVPFPQVPSGSSQGLKITAYQSLHGVVTAAGASAALRNAVSTTTLKDFRRDIIEGFVDPDRYAPQTVGFHDDQNLATTLGSIAAASLTAAERQTIYQVEDSLAMARRASTIKLINDLDLTVQPTMPASTPPAAVTAVTAARAQLSTAKVLMSQVSQLLMRGSPPGVDPQCDGAVRGRCPTRHGHAPRVVPRRR